jgi:hypothetical protein
MQLSVQTRGVGGGAITRLCGYQCKPRGDGGGGIAATRLT